jgi:hypothetical protein
MSLHSLILIFAAALHFTHLRALRVFNELLRSPPWSHRHKVQNLWRWRWRRDGDSQFKKSVLIFITLAHACERYSKLFSDFPFSWALCLKLCRACDMEKLSSGPVLSTLNSAVIIHSDSDSGLYSLCIFNSLAPFAICIYFQNQNHRPGSRLPQNHWTWLDKKWLVSASLKCEMEMRWINLIAIDCIRVWYAGKAFYRNAEGFLGFKV